MLKTLKNINNTIKKSIQKNTIEKKFRLKKMESKFELDNLKSETKCKETYLELTSNKDKLEQLYKNTNIKFELAVGNISKKEYELQMNKHKQMIDRLLCSLSYEKVTCEDLLKLYGSE